MSLVTEDVIIHLLSVFKRLKEKQHTEMLYGNETVCSVYYFFKKIIFELLFRKCNEKCNEMKSNQL